MFCIYMCRFNLGSEAYPYMWGNQDVKGKNNVTDTIDMHSRWITSVILEEMTTHKAAKQ